MPRNSEVKDIKEPFFGTRVNEQQKKESLRIMEVILTVDDIRNEMKSKISDIMIWNYTGAINGAYGKYLIKYRSWNSMYLEDVEIVHEHVYKRHNLVKTILNEGKIGNEIIHKMVACVVTKKEHEKLGSIADNSINGWARYEKAKIKVIDKEANCELQYDL